MFTRVHHSNHSITHVLRVFRTVTRAHQLPLDAHHRLTHSLPLLPRRRRPLQRGASEQASDRSDSDRPRRRSQPRRARQLRPRPAQRLQRLRAQALRQRAHAREVRTDRRPLRRPKAHRGDVEAVRRLRVVHTREP